MAKAKTRRRKTPSKMVSDQEALKKACDPELVSTTAKQDTSSLPPRPDGKLGQIVDRLGAATGATAEELAEAIGWQDAQPPTTPSPGRRGLRGWSPEGPGDRQQYRFLPAASPVQ
jgi:hypothetical protein